MRLLVLSFLIHIYAPLCAQQQGYAHWDSEELVLDNGQIKRIITLREGKVSSTDLFIPGHNDNFLDERSQEFLVSVDDVVYTGISTTWTILGIRDYKDEYGGKGAMLSIKPIQNADFRIDLHYVLYPDLPVIRKFMVIANLGDEELMVESVDVENIQVQFDFDETLVLNNYARNRHIGQLFKGDHYDPAVVLHQMDTHRGLVIGNEAPGFSKRTTIYHDGGRRITAGLTHPEEQFPTRAWIKPGTLWASTKTFIVPYANTDMPFRVMDGPVNDFVRRHLGVRLADVPKKPVFVYNTWEPFWHDIHEKMVLEIADAAAACGVEEFIIDDGWQTNYGDWGINKEKFPNGLKPVFDYIKSKGMKPGIWISLATAQADSKVYREHPEWLVRKADGDPINLQHDYDRQYDWISHTMCMGTDWYDHIKGVILNLVHEHGLEYLKADFAIVSGAYTFNKDRSGCHAQHPWHKDRPEAILNNYRRTWQLFDDLHKEAPDLFIDCTYETMGSLQLIDYDMCKHADGNWLSNFNEPSPAGALRVRNMAWWRAPVIPATTMVIGNQKMDDTLSLLSFKSLAGTLPIMLGDPRNLTDEKRKEFRSWGRWLRTMEEKHDVMMYRQDLEGFGEPKEGQWDGYQRINNDTGSGGIVGVFNHGAREKQRQVFVNYLDPETEYQIKVAPEGETVTKMTGRKLRDEGFTVELKGPYEAVIYEVDRIE